jgi:hypothetical protein
MIQLLDNIKNFYTQPSIMTKASHFCWLIFFSFFGCIIACGDIIERIETLTEEINKHAISAYLYSKRGKLNYLYEEYNKSIPDLYDSRKLRYFSGEQQLFETIVHAKSNNFSNTLNYIDIVLTVVPITVVAISLKEIILYKQHKCIISALEFEEVLQISNHILPFTLQVFASWKKGNRRPAIYSRRDSDKE